MVQFQQLVAGTYTLTETQAPKGYVTPTTSWKVKVTADSNKNLSAKIYLADGRTELGKLTGGEYQIINSASTPVQPPTPGIVETKKELSHEKYIAKNDEDGTYNLTLNVSGAVGSESYANKLDVLFVMDTSNSMKRGMDSSRDQNNYTTNSSSRFYNQQKAVEDAVAKLKNKKNVDAQFAVVAFDTQAGIETEWTKDSIKYPTGVGNYSGYNKKAGGTNYEAGLIKAKELLDRGRTDATKIVVFLSDGDPTFYYKKDSQGNITGIGGGDGNSYSDTAMANAQTQLSKMSMNYFYTVGVGPKDSYDHLSNLISSFAMGTTILLGQQIGSGKKEEGGRTVGTAIVMFAAIAVVMSIIMVVFAPSISQIMNAPEEAFQKTVDYIRICGGGLLVIVAYNLIGCIFRGLGDSKTPLITVAIACVFNIAGDLILCAGFHMGTQGAAIATVFALIVSVVVSFFLICKKELPFTVKNKNIRIHKVYLKKMVGFGAPIALQDLLVSISFLIILAIVNSMGVIASAGVGVAEKVCAFIMLISSAFMQSMSAFVAQNYGAGQITRARKALHYGIAVSFSIGVVMFLITFFHGDALAGIFSSDGEVVFAAADYLKAYAIDCLFTAIFFCYTGFYNGIGKTRFVMSQGILGAFCGRVPVSYIMSIQPETSLFHIGLATPMSSALQLILCVGFMLFLRKKGMLDDKKI